MDPQIEHFTDASDERSLARPGLSVIDFWAGWCEPCRMMAPQFEKAAALRPAYHFAKVDVDAAPGLAERFGIRSIPTLAVLRDGKLVAMQPGVLGAGQLIEALDRIAAAGTVTVFSAMLSLLVSKWCVLLAGLVGLNQWLYVATGSCPASLLLRRSCRLQSVMSVDDDRANARVRGVTV